MSCPPRRRMRVPALGNHPGTRCSPGYRRSSLRLAAGPGPGCCAYRHWASRTRAVSLLTGGYTPLLALYLMRRKGPQLTYSHNLRGGARGGTGAFARADPVRGLGNPTAPETACGRRGRLGDSLDRHGEANRVRALSPHSRYKIILSGPKISAGFS